MSSKLIAGIIMLCSFATLIAPAMGQTTAADWNDQSVALYNQDKYDEAIQACEKAIELDPNLAAAWINMGNALDELGKSNEAIKAYEEAIRLDLNNTNAWANKGETLEQTEKV